MPPKEGEKGIDIAIPKNHDTKIRTLMLKSLGEGRLHCKRFFNSGGCNTSWKKFAM